MSKTKKEKLPDLNRVPFKTRVRPYLIVAPSLIITIGIMVPFVMAIWYSLTNFSFKLPTHKFIGLTNWVNVLSSGSTWKAIWVTLLYGVASTVVEMALGMGVAIPHGTSEKKSTVKKSGVVMLQYPDGVDFGDEKAYLIFGIAGVGDAHLDLLAHVCEVLEDEEALEMMKKTPDIKFVLTHLQ